MSKKCKKLKRKNAALRAGLNAEHKRGYDLLWDLRLCSRRLHIIKDQLDELSDKYWRDQWLISQLSAIAEKAARDLDDGAGFQSWIPVEGRLPKCERGCEVGDIAYVVKSSNTVLCGCYGRGGKYRDSYFRTWNDASEGVDASDVSFWMPLPSAPEV